MKSTTKNTNLRRGPRPMGSSPWRMRFAHQRPQMPAMSSTTTARAGDGNNLRINREEMTGVSEDRGRTRMCFLSSIIQEALDIGDDSNFCSETNTRTTRTRTRSNATDSTSLPPSN
ncbi:expressed unknown protein [Seminavis robusta]|uniref:Uncharacterized protein n=1 Tax=Seminavis robusta TaxID=568900 RepID=A0A9N8EHF4_9STRA|nr:expressed unknown protein [Seminavis robusta]|eukprot:Sro1085_g239591.1  (116) ;mRNA; r:12015-12362